MLIKSYSSHSSTLHKQIRILVSFSPLHLAQLKRYSCLFLISTLLNAKAYFCLFLSSSLRSQINAYSILFFSFFYLAQANAYSRFFFSAPPCKRSFAYFCPLPCSSQIFLLLLSLPWLLNLILRIPLPCARNCLFSFLFLHSTWLNSNCILAYFLSPPCSTRKRVLAYFCPLPCSSQILLLPLSLP